MNGAALDLPRLPEVPEPTSFEGLRLAGLAALRDLAGERWTDHNLHDPGITMLEALCFSLSDIAYRVGFPVADHLRDADGQLDWAGHGLHLPEQALPCRPTTADDLRRWLLDRIPTLDGVAVHPLGPGRLGLVLDAAEDQDLTRLARRVRRACDARRALGEEVAGLRFVVKRECTLRGELELGGARDPVDIVAELYEACAAFVAGAVEYDSCREAIARGLPLDEVLDGPQTPRGIVRPGALALAASDKLPVQRMAEVARRVEGVRELRWLGLQREGGATVTTTLTWRDPGDAWMLALRAPTDDGAWSGLKVLRRGMAVELPTDELARRCAELRAARLARRQGLGRVREAWPPPPGRHRPPVPYVPLQDLLPPMYAVGRQGPPGHATPLQRARARQLQGYLALFDHALSQTGAQTNGLRGLFHAGTEAAAPSYAVQALDDEQAPGLAELLDAAPESVAEAVHDGLDPAIERRSRMLDAQLALHGHEWPQNSLRQFCDHLTPRERERFLLEAKRAYALDIDRLSRDRAAGIDLGRRSWGAPNNIAGLQRLACHLLGFSDPRSRALAAPPEAEAAEPPLDAAPAGLQRIDLDSAEAAGSEEQALRGPAAMLRCAVRHDRWWTLARAGGRVALMLGADEQGRWWPLGDGLAPATALKLAARRRRWALAQEAAAEGLHLIEHGLLRPIDAGPSDAGSAFHDLRASVLLAGWTQRGSRSAFRGFAEETLRLAAPAHLALRCLWLEPQAMHHLQTLLHRWLEQRLAWSRRETDAAAVDAAAAALVRALREAAP
jgi:hypothetical protein